MLALVASVKLGCAGRARTCDIRRNKPAHYQLCYRAIGVIGARFRALGIDAENARGRRVRLHESDVQGDALGMD